jgi:hypothetical protein
VVLETRATTEFPSAGDVLTIGFVAASQLAAVAAWAVFTAWMLINLLRWLG